MKRVIYEIRVIPNAKKNGFVKEHGRLKAYVTEPPSGNKANMAVIRVLADFLGAKRSKMRIVKGARSRDKVVEIS